LQGAHINFLRLDYDTAVFQAFKEVEVAIRDAVQLPSELVGVKLARTAFATKEGALTRKEDPEAEQDALQHLFAGALGSYKNPHSHRSVALTDATDVAEMLMMASHLLRIVDSRRR
jgi:uncharacterized protein (TIGR02391 family)